MYLIHISPTNRCSGFPYVETPMAVWRQYSPKIYDTYFTSEQVGETGIGHTIYGKPEYLHVGEIGIRYMLHISWYCFDNKQVLLPAVIVGFRKWTMTMFLVRKTYGQPHPKSGSQQCTQTPTEKAHEQTIEKERWTAHKANHASPSHTTAHALILNMKCEYMRVNLLKNGIKI